MQFRLTEEEEIKVRAWKQEQDQITYEKQVKAGKYSSSLSHAKGKPEYGAIGGELTYLFTPTGLGCIVKVIHGGTHAELDLTDVGDW